MLSSGAAKKNGGARWRVALPALVSGLALSLMILGAPASAIAARVARAAATTATTASWALPPSVAPLPASAEQSKAHPSTASPDTPVVRVGTTLTVGSLPTGIATTNTTAYVANADSNTVSIINLAANPPVVTGSPIGVGAFPAALALSSDGSQLFVANFYGDSLSIVNTSNDTVTATVGVGTAPDAVLEVGSSVYVSNLSSGTLSVVNPANGTAGTPIVLPSGGSGQAAPSGLAAIGSTLYVEDVRNGRIDVVNTSDGTTTGTVAVGSLPANLSIAGSTGFATNPGSDSVSVLDMTPSPPTVTATPTVGTAPYGIAGSSPLGEALVANSGSNNVGVLDSTTNALVGTPVIVGSVPDDVVLTPDGTKTVVSNESDGTVTVLSVNQPPTLSVPGSQQAGNNPNALVFSTGNSNAITAGDGDAGTGPVKVAASVSHATLTLGSTAGLTINAGSNGSSSVTFTGTVSNVNAALAGMSYVATASYSGSDSLSLSVNDLGNTANIGKPETTSSSVAISVLAPPAIASSPSYSGAVGNTPFGVGTTPSQPSTSTTGNLLTDSGATDPNSRTLTVLTSGNPITTTNGGKVTVNSSGTFTYVPAAGYTGTDSFTFTVTDGVSTATGTASVVVAHMVWYVNDTLGTNGNGTSASPFNTLASVNPASSANDYAFLFGSGTSYAGGITLKAGQTLVGQSVGLVVGTATLVTASGTNPTITNTGGNGVTLGEGATVTGVTVNATSSAGIAGAINTATITASVSITNTTGPGLDITGGTSGTLADAATITETTTATTAPALTVSGRTGGTVNQTGAITGATNLTTNTGATINISGAITASTSTLTAFNATGGGTVNVTGTTNTLTTTTATALDVENTGIGASGLTFRSISTGSASAGPLHGIYLVGTGTVGGLTVTGNGSTASGGDSSGGTIYATGNTSTDNAAIEIGTPELTTSTTPSPVGPVSLTDMAVKKAGTASFEGVYGANVSSFTLAYSTITTEDYGLKLTGYGSSNGQFNIIGNIITGSVNTALYVFYPELDASPATNGTTGTNEGYINANTIGNQSVTNSGASGGGDGIQTWETGTGTLNVDIENNSVYQIAQGYGMSTANGEGGGTLNVTVQGNTVNMDNTSSADAIYVEESTPGSLCANVNPNTATPTVKNNFTAAGINDANDSGFDATGFLIGSAQPSPLTLQGYTGPSSDSGGQVESFIESVNNLSAPTTGNSPALALAGSDTGGALDFVGGTCSTAFGSAPAIAAPAPAGGEPTTTATATPTATAGPTTTAAPAATATHGGAPRTAIAVKAKAKHASHKRISRSHHRKHVTSKHKRARKLRTVDIRPAIAAIVHTVRGVTAR
ncbi:MAG TPA: Ig-like domain-containing protein [Solirubrobacteraceae bacterium]|jgi:YVTN family beta-propeller protein|nr:Ig-like domain-containing protein [Solirubrobacteraceae bacterium]